MSAPVLEVKLATQPECQFGERVRFSRGGKYPRRYTLFTVRKDKHIYFGISKWNVKHDDYDRAAGVKQAKERAYAVDHPQHSSLDSFISKGGFSGKFRLRDFTKMLEHFERLR